MMPLERAQLKLQVFAMLGGWGHAPEHASENSQHEKGSILAMMNAPPILWSVDERMKKADQLVEWALSVPAGDKEGQA